MTRSRARLALATAVGMIATGALSTAAVTPAQAATPPHIKVWVTKGHHVHMTTHMRPGVHKFGVRSARSASFQLIRPHAGYTKRELVHDVATGLNTDNPTPKALRAIKRFERHVTLVGGVPSGPHRRGVMWADLTRGTYWAADTNDPKTTVADLLTVRVGGRRVAGAMPRGSTVRAINEVDWAKRPASMPHAGIMTFRNDSEDNHFVAMARLKKGKTMADFRRWINKAKRGVDPGPPPVNESAPELDSGVVSPGHEMAMRYDLPRGHYVMICWWPDADMGGMPHAFMGMYRGIWLK
jgi:hypothetical protein